MRIPASIANIRVLQTWGVHPKAVKYINCPWMEQKLAAFECCCGWVWTGRDSRRHGAPEGVQILLAHQLKKPLVIYPWGKTPGNYLCSLWLGPGIHHVGTAHVPQGISAQLECRAGRVSAVASLLVVFFPWLTTSELSCETMLRSMPAIVIALEMDSLHLTSRIGIVNSPYRINEQAVT